MRLNNNSKIITEDDIIMSDGVSSLSDVLSSHQEQLSKLSSNLKWIYKYGGVGGTGGGGGTTPTQSFSIFASLNDVQLKDQSIILDGVGLYPLSIKINNPNGASFNVKYQYTTKSETGNDIKQEQTVILSIENNYTLDTQISLNTNSTLQITASDGNETKQVMCNYIVTPYEFTLSLVDNDGNKVSNEHFIETAAKKGVNVKLTYIISIQANIQYTYTFLDDKQSGTISDSNNSILFPLDSGLFVQESAGYYTANVDLSIVPEGQDLVTLNKSISFSLIPEDLYMLISPQIGVIYEEETEDPYQYTPGYLTFNYRIYEGISQNRTYTVDIKLNGVSVVNQSVIERQEYTFKLFTVTSGVNTLEIQVSRATQYNKTYYFYIQESSLSLDWFDNPSEWTSYYYRINEVTDNFSQYKNKLYIEQTVNTPAIEISNTNPPNVSANSLINTHIAIGLQYNTINSEDPIIMNFYNSSAGTSPVLSIQQSKVTRQGQEAELYIKKQVDTNKDTIQNYHLIQIYSQYVKKIGNEYYYEISLYIDGILESVFGQITNVPLLTDKLSIEPVNCYINLLEVDYKETEDGQHNNCDYEVYKYYLKYKNEILRQEVGSEMFLLDYLKNFQVGLDGRVTINQADINNIAKNIDTPVLLMTYQDDGQFDSMGGFMEALEAGYGEDGTGIGSDMNFQVSVAWSPGQNSVDTLQLPSGFETARFRASLQGSSTKMYRVKNFNLSIENTAGTEEDEVYLFSPNFEDGDTSTFLPETEFTLKADVVDSSHSNNTSCGRFVNKVCRKFSTDISDNSYYKNYIKNCLDGFPTLLFLCHVQTDELTEETTNTYYYLGVYNFNLGRTSYYNLGYKDLTIFGDQENKLLTNAGNSFTFFKIAPSQNVLREGLGVAEIQGGDPHFDFSQWDPTVLFQQISTDPRYMFGDLVYGSNGTEQQLKQSISNFVQKVAKSGGYLFDFLKKNKGKYETDNVEEGSGYNAEVYKDGEPTGESKNQVPDYSIQYEKYLSPSGSWEFREKGGDPIKGTQLDLQDLIIPDVDSGKQASLNFQAASEYYTICMTLGLVDSVMKNLNIKTWNTKSDGTATWYPAFYDMDTCLGINNQGNPISYFAFSDYWHSQITKTINEVEYPTAVRIYRDFSPHSLGENGYDVPTNYLFTVAKYAKLIFTDNSSDQSVYLAQYPQELYAKWRSNTQNPETNEGVLKNADVFMENFFSNNLAAICPALVSYNYRSKYLKLENAGDTVWVSTDFNKFNGTRVNKVRDWLDGRLHILDVYFNLNRSMPQTITYRTEEGTWETLMNGSAPVQDVMYSTNYDLANNDDVVILKDIFSAGGGSGVQLSGFVSFQIRCPEFSPLQIYNQIGSVHENYILGGDKNQQVEFTPTGVQNVKLGGSQAWTYLQDINWITTSGLYITSDKLENITGSSGKFTSLQLKTPNVKTISLTSSNYSGSLQLDGVDNYPNLSEINISGSQINLTANNLNVKKININNMNAQNSEVTITNCDSIEQLSTSNVRLRSLHIEGLKGTLKNFSLSNTNINSITVKGGETGGTFTLIGDQTVTSVSIGDFQKVVIQNCPKLTKVTINQKTIQDVEELQIINCQATGLAITSEASSTAGKVTLSNSKLKRVSFKQCVGITNVELPQNVTLLSGAFQDCRNLVTISGTNIYINSSVFRNCSSYALLNKEGSYSDLTVESSVTDLSYAFLGTLITWKEVKHIIDNIIPIENSITNISYMFAYCTLAVFSLEDLKTSISESSYPNFGKLSKVTDASYLFYNPQNTGVNAINKNFMQLGSTEGCNYDQAFCTKDSLSILYVPIDLFQGTITKVTYLPFGAYNGRVTHITFVDSSGEILSSDSDIKMSEFLNPGGQSPTKLISLRYIQTTSQYTLDWTNTFTAAWVKLSSISYVCPEQSKYKGYENLCKQLPNIISISESWNKSTLTDQTADYFNMYNWDKLVNQSEIFKMDYNLHYNTKCNACAKYISAENYSILCEKILKSKSLTSINTIFRNVTVVGSLGTWTFGSTVNSRIKKAALAFNDFQNKTTLEASSSNNLMMDTNFCRTIPSLENVMGMFRGCKFGVAIPFDLFKKRNEVIESVWIKKEDNYEPATFYNYNYSQVMYDMSFLFENCEWTQECLQYNPALYSIKKARVVDSLDEEYTEYYTRTLISSDEEPNYVYTQHTLEQVTEVTDAENLQGGYVANIQGTSITNPSINGDANRLIIPPDLFYGLKANISTTSEYDLSYGVQAALACKTALNGIIPKNIFKNSKTVKCTNLWKGQTIIPQLVKSWKQENTTYNVYVHYPSSYTSYGILDNAFNSEYIVLQDSSFGDEQVVNYSLVLLQDSIPQITSSLQNAFAGINRWAAIGHILPEDVAQQFNFIGKLGDNQLILGLDPTYFTQLNMNNMFASNYIQVVKGNLFSSGFDAKNIKLSNTSDVVIKIIRNLGGEADNVIARTMILPKATGSISQLSSPNYSIYSTQITDSSTSLQYYRQAGWIIDDEMES